MNKVSRKADRQRAQDKGHRAEWFAGLLLSLKGYQILARRWKSPAGEIDLIARRGRLIAFVEVKARASHDDAILAVTPQARRRIERAAAIYLSHHAAFCEFDVRYDIMPVSGLRVAHLRDAWRAGDR